MSKEIQRPACSYSSQFKCSKQRVSCQCPLKLRMQRTGMIHRTLHSFSVDMKAMVLMCLMSCVGIIIEHTCSCLKKQTRIYSGFSVINTGSNVSIRAQIYAYFCLNHLISGSDGSRVFFFNWQSEWMNLLCDRDYLELEVSIFQDTIRICLRALRTLGTSKELKNCRFIQVGNVSLWNFESQWSDFYAGWRGC